MGAGIPGSGSLYGRGVFHHAIRGPPPTHAAGIPHSMADTGLDQAYRRNLENVTCFKVSMEENLQYIMSHVTRVQDF